jgi:hypothetical protein
MLALLPGAIAFLPPGSVAYDWYYYPFGRRPRIELRNFAAYEIAPALRARGVEYWGCPMNGAFRHEPLPIFGERLANIRAWWQRCRRVEAAGMLITSWEPNRLAIEMTTVVDAAAAGLWLDPGADDTPGLLRGGFERVYGGAHGGEWARLALACDERAFAGYARWEINQRWNGCDLRRGLAGYEEERAFYRRLSRRAPALPKPFGASVDFRLYLAERDVFVRSLARSIPALRRRMARPDRGNARIRAEVDALLESVRRFQRTLAGGRRAARRLWRLTRDPRQPDPNGRMLREDGARLLEVRRWLRRCAAQPRHLLSGSPLFGGWQLNLDVVLTEPALQQVRVESQSGDGTWQTIEARMTIEFRARAARPRASIRREFSVPVPGPDSGLRIAVRGLGRIGLANVELTDGVGALRPRGWSGPRCRRIGSPAPREGFPRLDWERNAGSIELVFARKKGGGPWGPPP